MAFGKVFFSFITLNLLILRVYAESHEIAFTNDCGFGTPILRAQNGDILSEGETITIESELVDAIAYLQTGNCGDNGENCTVIETTLINGASITNISIIPPHEFSVTTGFGYFDGCQPAGADCTSADTCSPPFVGPDGPRVLQVTCTVPDCGLAISFCD